MRDAQWCEIKHFLLGSVNKNCPIAFTQKCVAIIAYFPRNDDYLGLCIPAI